MGIERDLAELLHDHDCVIVPQWGGFLTHYRPARLDGARHLIHPPAKGLASIGIWSAMMVYWPIIWRNATGSILGRPTSVSSSRSALWAGVLEPRRPTGTPAHGHLLPG
ncbi:MAG: hypothetical protein IPN62_08680 [Flavobacteriales bacterium]|nr:hypothetical protein [Flavobacteriales bacterium]